MAIGTTINVNGWVGTLVCTGGVFGLFKSKDGSQFVFSLYKIQEKEIVIN